MGYLDRFKPRGGGFLNDRDGQIVGTAFKAGRLDGGPNNGGAVVPLWAVFYIQEDGRDEVTIQHFKIAGRGGDTNWKISPNGKTAKALTEDAVIWRTEDGLSQLLASMVDTAGMDESQFPDPAVASDLCFEFLEGERFHWVQVKRTDAYAKAHKRKDKNDPSKEYDLTYTAVSRHYGNPDRANGKAQEETNQLIALKGQQALAKALKAKGGKIAQKDLKPALANQLMGDADRNAVTDYVVENLATLEGVIVDGGMVRSEIPF